MGDSEVKFFFENQTIFITGGTGSVGKILVEKLLRVCNVKKLYLLVRPKKEKTVEERYHEFFSYPCFEKVLDSKEKVFFISGNCEAPDLGLSTADSDMLIKEITIVIHAAANVRFDQSLKIAFNCNVRATRNILKLAKKCPLLKSFVHVSTAYSNYPYHEIKEEFYEPPCSPDTLSGILDSFNDKIIDEITPKLLQGWPNTYVFTKAIGENLVKIEKDNLPVAIVRPAIVVPTAEEPVIGWCDSFYGIVGIAFGAGLGVVKSFHGNTDCVANLVPLDYVVNLIITAAWDVATNNDGIPIYNFVGSLNNLTTWGRLAQNLTEQYLNNPSSKAVWYMSFDIRTNLFLHNLNVFLKHTLVAYFVDFVLFCIGKKTLAVKIYDRINKLLGMLSHFMIREWHFSVDNVEKLWSKMKHEDKKLFKFQMDSIDWSLYLKSAVCGGRVYLINDPLTTMSYAKRKLKVLLLIHYIFNLLCFFLLYKLFKTILF